MKSFRVALIVALLCPIACSKNNTGTSGITGSGGASALQPGQAGISAQGASGATGSSGSGTVVKGSGGMLGASGTTTVANAGTTATAGQTGASGAGGTATVGSSGAGGAAGVMSTAGSVAAPPEVMGCGTTKLYQVPDDPGAPGPWPVGVKTISVAIAGGTIPVEIWYPAKLGSNSGQTKVTYDLGDYVKVIPPYTTGITPEESVIQTCDCYRDIPIDNTHGPYPLVVFVHGTASFRTLSGSTMTQWASRGFVVAAADHPTLGLQDVIAFAGQCAGTGIDQDVRRDVTATIAGFTAKSGDFAAFGDSVDLTRIGVSGHSQGASEAAGLGTLPNVQIGIPMADFGGAGVVGSAIASSLVIGGMDDGVVPYSDDQRAYIASGGQTKRIVGMTGGDHMNVTDFCSLRNSAGETSLDVGAKHAICGGAGIAFIATLARCGSMDAKKGTAITTYTSTAALEETLHCVDRKAAWDGLKTKYPEVGDFQHTP